MVFIVSHADLMKSESVDKSTTRIPNDNEEIRMELENTPIMYEEIEPTLKQKQKWISQTQNLCIVPFQNVILTGLLCLIPLVFITLRKNSNYLSSLVQFSKARAAYLQQKNIWNSKQLSTNIKTSQGDLPWIHGLNRAGVNQKPYNTLGRERRFFCNPMGCV
ncbi:unnamed protein product [Schistosoma margrebowiei]|uniref:Uncharacterized protein n=1 Tax=Schistosoma margrebowiei TaxID=48269 RepID=A0A183LPM4_9TREM|nr:unnamed protein product [Schistosoma margrebowiei]